MNKSRELFLLFPFQENVNGYTIIYVHHFMNDEPPYIMVKYWGLGKYTQEVYPEEGECVSHYLIRNADAERFIGLMNSSQTDYCDYYLEGIYTRNAGEHNLKPAEYAEGGYCRPPKVKYMSASPR